MLGFGIRNIKVFFKDKSAVFFSLLAVFIIIGLYALFLGDVWTDSFKGMTGVRYLMDSWIVAGLLAVTSVTTTMGAFGIMVDDKARKINKDYIASPIKKSSIVGGYIISAIVIGIIMSIVTLALSEAYVLSNGGKLMSFNVFLKALGLIVLTTIANSSMILFVVSFFKSINAFSTASTVIGTLIGFITGIYLPIGNLPESVQLLVKCFPASHGAVLFRQLLMEEPMAVSFKGAPTQAINEFNQLMGVEFVFDGAVLSPFVSVIILVATAVVFYLLSVLNLSKKVK